jgi:hypothetical protein
VAVRFTEHEWQSLRTAAATGNWSTAAFVAQCALAGATPSPGRDALLDATAALARVLRSQIGHLEYLHRGLSGPIIPSCINDIRRAVATVEESCTALYTDDEEVVLDHPGRPITEVRAQERADHALHRVGAKRSRASNDEPENLEVRFRIPAETNARAVARADAEGVTVDELSRRALEAFLDA